MVDNFANTGGVITINASNERVSETINAETINTVQTPIKYTYESRGLSIIHAGVDLVAPTGTNVYPIMEGQVIYTGNDIFGYGNHIIVKHDHDYESIYGHLSEIKVKKGDKVNLTTLIGKSGSTGLSTGPHLHLEIHHGGKVVNPTEIVPNVK
jgi:murein DD-endopeptidase MepM/ murein hydrolase activator NlpD